jgi:hypothetical protein
MMMALQAGIQACNSVPILVEDRANNSQPNLGYDGHPLHAAHANKAGGPPSMLVAKGGGERSTIRELLAGDEAGEHGLRGYQRMDTDSRACRQRKKAWHQSRPDISGYIRIYKESAALRA